MAVAQVCLVAPCLAVTPLVRPEFQLVNELPPGETPAGFQMTEAQVAFCRAPLMPGMEMYLDPIGWKCNGGCFWFEGMVGKIMAPK